MSCTPMLSYVANVGKLADLTSTDVPWPIVVRVLDVRTRFGTIDYLVEDGTVEAGAAVDLKKPAKWIEAWRLTNYRQEEVSR